MPCLCYVRHDGHGGQQGVRQVDGVLPRALGIRSQESLLPGMGLVNHNLVPLDCPRVGNAKLEWCDGRGGRAGRARERAGGV